jgi:excisionase family DNA binding protein
MKCQYMPPLSEAERAALTESIATFGVLQAVITDEDGTVLDGHHRAEIADELGIEYPTVTLPGLTDEQTIEQSLILNLGHRHLDIPSLVSGDRRRATLTIEETAALLRLGRTATYEAVRRRQIPSRRLGRRIVVPVPALLDWLSSDGDE